MRPAVYTLLRRLHLYSALFLGMFLLMYAFTGFVIFAGWFPDNEEVTTVTGTGDFTPPENADWEATKNAGAKVAPEYRRRYAITGRYETFTRHDDGRFDLVFRRPGDETRVRFFPNSDSLTVIQRKYGFAYLMNRLHSFRWYEGGILFQLWALLLDLAAVAMILFALSGILLWYTLKARNRRLGWFILCSGGAYTVGSIVYLMVAL